MASHDRYVHQILDRVADETLISQRSLSRELGIALGLTNLLLRKIVRKGWVRIVRIRPNRVRYLITPTGLAEKAQMYRAQLAYNLRFYRETRDRIQESLERLSIDWPQPSDGSPRAHRVVLYGAGEVAEIGFVCLQGTNWDLVGVVDERRGRAFFGLPVHPPDRLAGTTIDGMSFDRLVIMSLKDTDDIRLKVLARGVPAEVVHAI